MSGMSNSSISEQAVCRAEAISWTTLLRFIKLYEDHLPSWSQCESFSSALRAVLHVLHIHKELPSHLLEFIFRNEWLQVWVITRNKKYRTSLTTKTKKKVHSPSRTVKCIWTWRETRRWSERLKQSKHLRSSSLQLLNSWSIKLWLGFKSLLFPTIQEPLSHYCEWSCFWKPAVRSDGQLCSAVMRSCPVIACEVVNLTEEAARVMS